MRDLIYCENLEEKKRLWEAVLKRFPETIINDASDEIHGERIEINILDAKPPITDGYIKFAIRNGFFQFSFGIQVLLRDSSEKTKTRFKRLRKEMAGMVREKK